MPPSPFSLRCKATPAAELFLDGAGIGFDYYRKDKYGIEKRIDKYFERLKK